ncbi:MAG: hypothetical protein ACHQAQ_04760 [Hyphomicrobiales bacterium]
MSFGNRGIDPPSNDPARAGTSKQYFINSSSTSLRMSLPGGLKLSAIWPDGTALGGLLYPLSCLALGVVLGGGVGAVLAPQLLHAEDAGIYDFIRMNAAQQARRAPRPAFQPRFSLPQLSFRHPRGRANVMQARLPPEWRAHAERRPGARAIASREPDSGICSGCSKARYSSPLEAILNDKTLRAGDTVMMTMGAVVFRGAKRLPYTAADFMDFRQSTLLTKKERRQIDDALGLTRSVDALRVFGSKVRTSQAFPDPTRPQAMRAFFPISQPAAQPVTQAVR